MAGMQRNRGRAGVAPLVALALPLAAPLLAAPAPALGAEGGLRAVIAVSDPQRAGGASALSRAAMARGADARRLEAPAPEALTRAIADAQPGEATMVLALSAASRAEDGSTLLYGFGPRPLPLDRLLDDLVGAVLPPAEPPQDEAAQDAMPETATPGSDPEEAAPVAVAAPTPPASVRVLMVLDACATDPASSVAEIAPRPGLALALLPAPGAACPAEAGPGALAALADTLAGQGDLAGLALRTGAIWVTEPGAALPDLRPPAASATLVAAGPAPTRIGPAAGATGGDIILLPRGAASQAAMPRAAVPLAPATGRLTQATGGGVVLASAAPAGAVLDALPISGPLSGPGPAPLAARPTAPGMPEPSIIVGSLRPPAEAAPTGLLGTLTGGAVGTGLEDRQRLRSEDPGLYATLVGQGAFDPEPAALTASLQAELNRMGCYTGAIDGSWGNGSRAGVDAYFREAGGQPLTREPEIALFRQILGGSEVTCPAPVARATPAAATPAASRTTPGRGAGGGGAAAPRAPTAAQPTQPAQTAPAQGNLGNALRGTGIIR